MSLTNEDLKAITDLINPLNGRLDKMDEQLDKVKKQIKWTERNLKAEIAESENLILDEIERVHHILDKHKQDKTVHTASNLNAWWWLSTPDSTPSGYGSDGVQYVYS